MKANTSLRARLRGLLLVLGIPAAVANDAPIPASTMQEQPAANLAAHRAVPLTRENIEAFVDEFMADSSVEQTVAGATVAVVKDGSLLFAKGYGHEDVANRVPVDAEQTSFRMGSISKIFTATAVMQLVERGELDLDADVNAYLVDFKIPATYPEPVTLRNLLTHTAGFEETSLKSYEPAASAEKTLSVASWLKTYMPARVRPAARDFSSGANASYSNWGVTLAGHIVELESGMPFDDYMERNILEPLGMTRSTFREPIPPALDARMSGGYIAGKHGFERQPLELIHYAAPAGALTATSTDLAKFVLAILQEGSLGDVRILTAESVRTMLSRIVSPAPEVNGIGLAFYENLINGHRVVGHGGDTNLFHSACYLLPEARLGFIAAVNTGGGGGQTAEKLVKAAVQHFLPAAVPRLSPPADAGARNKRYAGVYRPLRYSHSTLSKVFAALTGIAVEPQPDGTLSFIDPADRSPSRWVETREGVFRKVNEEVYVVFKGERRGQATHLIGPFSPIAAERVPWYSSSTLLFGGLGLGALSFAVMTISAIRYRKRAKTSDRGQDAKASRSMTSRLARPVLATATGLLLAPVLGVVLFIASLGNPAFPYRPVLYTAMTLGVIAVPLVAGAVYFTITLWRSRASSVVSRVHYTCAALIAVALLWLLSYWNLLGYDF